jgi:hypothetical protein
MTEQTLTTTHDETPPERDDRIIGDFYANGGMAESSHEWPQLLPLNTKDSTSGLSRTSPVAYWEHDEQVYPIASEDGAPHNPAVVEKLQPAFTSYAQLTTRSIP